MVLEKKADAEPIPGYRLLKQLGAGGFGEVWKCEAPGGIFKAIKFVYGNINGLSSVSRSAENELKAVQHIKSIRHPFLLSIDRLELIEGELVIVMELADQNMHQLAQKYQAAGQPGIPRQELLFYLREAAEVLDMLNTQCHLQHLDIKPGNLFLVGNHLKVADFGLVQSLTLNQPAGQLGAITPVYAAPEIFMGMLSPHCDQYSLAIVFQELLTGTLPFDGKNPRQLLLQHTKQEPDLRALSQADRIIVSRALNKNFTQRFGSCQDFIRALTEVESPSQRSDASSNRELPQTSPPPGETQVAVLQHTVKLATNAPPSLPPGVLTGYRFLECVTNSPLIETWKVQKPDGKPELVHFVYGCTLNDTVKLQELATRLNSLQHPGLVPTQVALAEPGRLILHGPAVHDTVRDRFIHSTKLKQPGIMRSELLDYIRAAAEILDYLYQQHSVQHLGLNPRNLMLDKGWLQLEEFGLNQLVWLPSGQDVAQRNVRYSAPELFRRQVTRSTDQYSLAVIYAEMLTGHHPFQGQDPRKRPAPDLKKLSVKDQAIIQRALSENPAERFSSATELTLALEGIPESQAQIEIQEDAFIKLLKTTRRVVGLPSIKNISEGVHQKIADLVTSIGGKPEGIVAEAPPLLLEENQVLEHRFQVCTPLGSARQHIEPFFAELGGRPVRQDEACYEMSLPLDSTVWQRLRGKQPSLDVRIDLSRVHVMSATPVEVLVHISTRNLERAQALEILEKNGPAILERLRNHVLVGSNKRMHDRLLWPQPLEVVPVDAQGQLEDPIDCRGKDISFSGMGMYLPHELDTREVILRLPNFVHPPSLSIPATLVRAHRCADGWYDVGALFHLPAVKKSMPEIFIP
jgi:serine/threonine protein kinase